jgi:small subunit ribosomal protein S20
MATHKSAEKRQRQSETHEQRNRRWKSRVRTVTKKVLEAVDQKKKDEAAAALKNAMVEISKAATKGALHKNTASRKISRLSVRVASL